MARSISTTEVKKHNKTDDVWLVVDDVIYDMTEFAPEHPGGPEIILKYAGQDATQAYSEIHAPSMIKKTLHPSKVIGALDKSTIDSDWIKTPAKPVPTSKEGKPDLSSLINTYDFEEVASRTLTPKTWAFYSSGATDLHSKRRNASTYSEIILRPRILTNVKDLDMSTTMLGQKMSAPIYCSPAAMARMVHPDGELAIARGCKSVGIPQCISTNASYSAEEIVAGAAEGPYGPEENGDTELPLFFQLYVDKQRHKSEELLRRMEGLGIKGIFVTVDAPVTGKREADERIKADESVVTPMSGAQAKNDAKGGSIGRLMGGYIDSSLSWKDLPWLRRSTTVPLVLKGVQTAMDAKRAADEGIDAIILSNHGGRSLDTAPAPILLLLELQKCCPEVFDKMEVYVDGGIMRGTDIFKALCLGARAVGLGRGFLYAVNYGQEGVEKYVDILKDELEVTMKMCGVTDLSQLHPGLLNTLAVDHLVPSSSEHPYAKWRPKARL